MRKVLGLDLGTNSIGWAVINSRVNEQAEKIWIELAGSRIIPMDAAVLGDFDKGNSRSQTSERTRFRSIRRLRERYLLRRERLHRVLHLLGFLPDHYIKNVDFEIHPGKFKSGTEPKLAWKETDAGTFEFIFQESFNEMLADFAVHQPQFVSDGKKIPYDWTIYYLRKKALTEKITKEELAWILLNFNQKRGYYQLRGEEEEENPNKLVEFYALQVVAVEATNEKKGNETWYNIHLENGWIYRRTSDVPLDWCGKTKEFIVTTDLENDGRPKKDKDGNVTRSFRAPKDDDWTLIKKKTEADIDRSHKKVGCYIYDALLKNPAQKVKGKLVRTVGRKFYKNELVEILRKQKEFHVELQDRKLYESCLHELYTHNEAHRNNIASRDFTYLFLDDIIFYQRPLKSKKSLIDDCPYEERSYKENGEEKKSPVKCIAKSHPLFQEFRLWQFTSNIKIYQRERRISMEDQPSLFPNQARKGGKLETDVDVTSAFLESEEDYVALFEWLNDRKEVDQKAFLKYPAFGLKKTAGDYRWNYVEDKIYPCNETRAFILSRLEKAGVSADFLSKEKEEALWHILYSVEDKQEIERALRTFADKNQLTDDFVEIFSKCPPFKKEYGSYSAKAIKKLLALMRKGKYWKEEAIDKKTRERIDKILAGECDENILLHVRERAIHLAKVTDFKALPLWLSCYVVYNRHSEAKDIDKWENPEDIDTYLKKFKQHSLRNPIVEQVITETLRTVRDIWKSVGRIDEIHVELGREMKNPSKVREQMTLQALENESTNLRVKALLMEFMNPEYEIENVRPYSPSQQDILRIFEDEVLHGEYEIPEEISLILKKFRESDTKKRPTKSEVLRYKLWMEQKYRSPYTGDIIPLGKLFTSAYEIEHVIPQSRYFDDSFSNKVICEAEVNKLKSNSLGYEFIKKHHGEIVELAFGKSVRIHSVEAYEKFIQDNYSRTRGKMKKMLLEDIPDAFIERQMNDTRYISKVVKGLLSNIVREKDANGELELEAVSKNVISCTGGVTDRLKRDWGVNDVWNELILPRFKRMNELTDSEAFTSFSENLQKMIPSMPLELQKGFNKKRIDHRHHAMDAIVIACATRNHINYLNNESAGKNSKTSRHDLQRLLCDKNKTDDKGNYKWVVKKPWDTFTQDVRLMLDTVIVSFKQNLRVINRTTNYYQHYNENGEKILDKQSKGDSWAIRKPMHKETVYGNVNLQRVRTVNLSAAINCLERIVDREFRSKLKELLNVGYNEKAISKYFKENTEIWKDINLSKISVYYFTNETKEPLVATRKALDKSFTAKRISESITDTGIQKILLRHLENREGNPELAFSPDGIEEMNRMIRDLNGGKFHQPILKVRVYTPQGNKFKIGNSGNKSDKFVVAAEGTNLFFAVYQTEDGKRVYETVPLSIVIERLKQGEKPAPERRENGDKLLFWLSPNDLVYIPTNDELVSGIIDIEDVDKRRVYKFVDSSGTTANFVPHTSARTIFSLAKESAKEYCSQEKIVQDEYGLGSPQSKNQKAISGEMIKEVCIPITVNRIGNIVELTNRR